MIVFIVYVLAYIATLFCMCKESHYDSMSELRIVDYVFALFFAFFESALILTLIAVVMMIWDCRNLPSYEQQREEFKQECFAKGGTFTYSMDRKYSMESGKTLCAIKGEK
jgi:hypothetical protein